MTGTVLHPRPRRPRAPRPRITRPPSLSLQGALTLPFVLSLAYVFIEYVRPQEKYDILYGLPLGVGSLVAFALAVVLSGHLSVGGPVGKWILALLTWALVCAILSPRPAAAMEAYWETLKIVPVYFLLVSAVRTRTQFYLFTLFLLLVFFLHTNFSVRGWVLSGFSGAAAGSYAGSGFLHNPNDYGAWLSSFWGVSLLLALHDKRRVFGKIDARWIHAVGTAAFVLAALTSSSRGTFVGFGAGALYFIMRHVKSVKARIGGLLLAVMAAGAFLFLLSDEQAARFETMGSEEDETAQERIETWGVAWKVAKDYPLTGVGIGQFVYVGQAYSTADQLFVQHNITLQALTALGFPGGLLLLGIVGAFFVQRGRSVNRFKARGDPLLAAIGMGMSVSMVSFLVNGQFITVLFYPFLWILLAVAGMHHDISLEAPPRGRPGGRRRPRRIARPSRRPPQPPPIRGVP